MLEKPQHEINKAWNWHPELPLENSPLFSWPPQPAVIARWLPAERQDELADAMVQAAKTPSHTYTQAQKDAINEGIADADAGRFATDEEVHAAFARFRAV